MLSALCFVLCYADLDQASLSARRGSSGIRDKSLVWYPLLYDVTAYRRDFAAYIDTNRLLKNPSIDKVVVVPSAPAIRDTAVGAWRKLWNH